MRRGAWLLVTLVLAGCGFHLRGQAPLPAVLATPYIEAADHYSPLYAALDERLRAAGAQPAADAASASAVIRLHEDATGRDLLARNQVRLTRDYGYDESAVLAKEHEEETLRVALAGEIADQILRRLAAL
jgi:LPS-assembly lipoprotein